MIIIIVMTCSIVWFSMNMIHLTVMQKRHKKINTHMKTISAKFLLCIHLSPLNLRHSSRFHFNPIEKLKINCFVNIS